MVPVLFILKRTPMEPAEFSVSVTAAAQKVGVDILAHHVALGLVLVLVAGGGNAGYAEGDVALLLGDHVIGELAVLSYGEGEGIPIDPVALIVGYLYVAYLLVAVVGKVESKGDACGGSLALYDLHGYAGVHHAEGQCPGRRRALFLGDGILVCDRGL